ncbi:MAG: response regulator, partial [Sandaracinobacteroides sp.]
MTRILVADDHPLFRASLVMAAGRVCKGAEIVEAGTLDRALAAARDGGGYDLVLLDLRMPGAEGCSGVALLHAELPATPILVVSAADPAHVVGAVQRFG